MAVLSSQASNPEIGSPADLKRKLTKELPDLLTLIGRNWLSLDQTCDLIGVSYQTLLRWIKPSKDKKTLEMVQPKLKAVRIGGTYRIYEEELRRFLDSGNLT